MKGTLCALLALCSAASAVEATSAQPSPQAPQEIPYFDMNIFSISYAWMKDCNNGLSVDELMGATLTLGQTFGETGDSYHSWYGRTGYLFGRESYPTYYASDSVRCEQSIIPVILGYTYHYKCTEELSTYVGAHAGFHYSKTHKKSSETFIRRIRSHTKFAPTVGLDFGATYKINKRISWNIGVNIDTSFSLYKEHNCVGFADISRENALTTTLHTGILVTF